MPELPELLHVQSKLRELVVGRHVSKDRVREPVVLRFAVHGNLSPGFRALALNDLFRKSHFLIFRFDGLDLAINPMLAGRLASWRRPGDRGAKHSLGFALEILPGLRSIRSGRTALPSTTRGWARPNLIATDDWKSIPGMQTGGIDILSPEFTRERFVSLLKHRRDQVRVFLLDKKALDSLGNAYADEVLFAAGIHPKTFCRSPVSHDDGLRLHRAIVEVIKEAAALEVARIATLAPRGEGARLPERALEGDLFRAVEPRSAKPECAAWTPISAPTASPPPARISWTGHRTGK